MSHLNLKTKAYEWIKQKIIDCELEPNVLMNEDQLCGEFQMSRTPVRDALGRLEQEGYIKILPKKGFVVIPLSVNEISMVFEGRMLVEPYIVLHCCQNISPEILNKLRVNLSEEKQSIDYNRKDVYSWDSEFHAAIVSCCKNSYLLNFYENLATQNQRLRIISGKSSKDRLLKTIEEHYAIYNALEDQDLRGAAEALEKHLIESREAAFQAMIDRYHSSNDAAQIFF